MWYPGVVVALAGIVCVLAASVGAQTRADGAGVISGYMPQQAMAGQVVTIYGTNLDGTLSVTFGKIASQSIAVDNTDGNWVRAVVPPGVAPGTVQITIENSGNPASIGGFKILPGSVPPRSAAWPIGKTAPASSAQLGGKLKLAPRIAGVSPTSGRAGTTVMITGANLGRALWLKFGGVRAHIRQSFASLIIGVVPRRAHSGRIAVHTAGGTGLSALRFVVAHAAI